MNHKLIEHNKMHRSHRVGWLRAAVLGANDGIVSTSSLIIGVAAADSGSHAVMIAGVAGLIAGALSMAAGEYVSVHSQADTEKADLQLERDNLEAEPDAELEELTLIYIDRGLEPDLAAEVAKQLTQHDALAAHARDELGFSDQFAANPMQAAGFSAASFAVGAIMPIMAAWLCGDRPMIVPVAGSSLLFLTILGAIAAKAGGANIIKGAVRVLFWGAFAMAATAVVGHLFGTSVS